MPIKSLSYQVVGNKLIYLDTFGKLKIYDLTTAETATIYEGKSTGLYVLDARYVCYTAFGVDWYKLYDLEIERFLLPELFNKKMGLLDTYNETYIIENVKYEVT